MMGLRPRQGNLRQVKVSDFSNCFVVCLCVFFFVVVVFIPTLLLQQVRIGGQNKNKIQFEPFFY